MDERAVKKKLFDRQDYQQKYITAIRKWVYFPNNSVSITAVELIAENKYQFITNTQEDVLFTYEILISNNKYVNVFDALMKARDNFDALMESEDYQVSDSFSDKEKDNGKNETKDFEGNDPTLPF